MKLHKSINTLIVRILMPQKAHLVRANEETKAKDIRKEVGWAFLSAKA